MALRHSTNSCTAHWLDAGMCVSTRWGSVYECILNKFCMWCTPLISNFYHKISVFSQFHAAWIKTILNRLPVFISQSCLNSILRLPIKISKITFLSILLKKKTTTKKSRHVYFMMCCKCMFPVLCRVRFVVASSTLAFCYHTYTCIYTQWDIVFNFYPFTETMVMIKEYLVLNVLHCQPFYSFHTKFSLYYYYHYIRYLNKKTYMHFIIFVRANEVCIRSLEV